MNGGFKFCRFLTIDKGGADIEFGFKVFGDKSIGRAIDAFKSNDMISSIDTMENGARDGGDARGAELGLVATAEGGDFVFCDFDSGIEQSRIDEGVRLMIESLVYGCPVFKSKERSLIEGRDDRAMSIFVGVVIEDGFVFEFFHRWKANSEQLMVDQS